MYTNEQLALKLAVEGHSNFPLPIRVQLENAEKYLNWLRANRGL